MISATELQQGAVLRVTTQTSCQDAVRTVVKAWDGPGSALALSPELLDSYAHEQKQYETRITRHGTANLRFVVLPMSEGQPRRTAIVDMSMPIFQPEESPEPQSKALINLAVALVDNAAMKLDAARIEITRLYPQRQVEQAVNPSLPTR